MPQEESQSEFYLKFVNHEKVEAYLKLGWKMPERCHLPNSHTYWACIMRWDKPEPPKEP